VIDRDTRENLLRKNERELPAGELSKRLLLPNVACGLRAEDPPKLTYDLPLRNLTLSFLRDRRNRHVRREVGLPHMPLRGLFVGVCKRHDPAL